MQTRKAIVLTSMVVLLMASMFNVHAVVADEVPNGGGPGDDLQVYFLKKSFDFCDDNPYGNDVTDRPVDMPGGSVPDGLEDIQTAGCVDNWVNGEQGREDNYAFTGEQIGELVVARDLDGAIAITHAMMQVDGDDIAYCNDVTPYYVQALASLTGAGGVFGPFGADELTDTIRWREHIVYDDGLTPSGILAEYPPQKSESTTAGFDPLYDKIFECIMTVTDDMNGLSPITVAVTDTVNGFVDEDAAVTPEQMWYFNPEVSLDIDLSSGTSVEFEDGYAGDLVYSTNSLTLENAAQGGVDIAVWLGGTDLTSPGIASKCPYSNVLDVEGIDGWTGMDFKCNLDNGLYIEQTWQDILNKNIKDSCWSVSDGVVNSTSNPKNVVETCLGLNPLFYGIENILENGHEADCSFKLRYPVPCIGEFTEGNLIILMRAI